jgi:hypothetical protein
MTATITNSTPTIEPSDHYGTWTDSDGNTHPIERSQKGHFWAIAMELWMQEIEDAYGFTSRIYDTPDGRGRVIELLGPDSPGEYVLTFPKWKLSDEYLADTVRELVLWMDERGRDYTGAYAPGVVPDEHRKG